MTPGRLQKLLTWLLVASLAHLPLPVWDGDDVGSRGTACVSADANRRDMDLILLGCDVPEDCDDGPTDDDPDDGTLDVGLGPAYVAAGAVVAPEPCESSLFADGLPRATDCRLLGASIRVQLPAGAFLAPDNERLASRAVLRL